MHYVELVAMLVIVQYLFFGALVGRARGRYGVKAPAVVGHEGFERAYRVQMNTLELMVALLPALFVAARFWPAAWVAGIGAVYLVGRFLYWRAYVSNPGSRALGFALTMLPVMALLLMALAGAVLR
ncbi:MAG: MAPEG family protein [Stenotrophomonas nitritireducens]|uniref:MAPEG family protein n=1 Tax=Stenotrophomonas nitritireducens TaxID=83617 RepID=UPI001ACDFEC4|nr:MAPEG family protein [Stenotrophomonas nitritireducens]MBN8793161.1 MAPEG family protein [Stenotrophomonas nitritireducens]MBN8797193.1 MAPEG family protein [Stenotrophomonas nitritireducens]